MRTELLAALVWLAMTAALAGIAATEDGGAGCGATTTGSASNAGPVLCDLTGLGRRASAPPVNGRLTCPRTDLIAAARERMPRELRRAKCRRLMATFAPWADDPELIDWFVTCHEVEGIPGQWYYSWLYAQANFGWGIGRTAPGRCYGPADVKWPYCARPPAAVLGDRPWNRHALLDPRVNLWCHTRQMADYHRQTGREGFALLRTVFYPAAPWGRATNRWAPRWHQWDCKARACLSDGYRAGKLP